MNTSLILPVLLAGSKITVRAISNYAEKLQKMPDHEINLVLLEFLIQEVRLWNSVKIFGVRRPRIMSNAILYSLYYFNTIGIQQLGVSMHVSKIM